MAVVETIRIEVSAPDAQAQVDKLTKDFEDLQKEVKDLNSELDKTSEATKKAGKSTSVLSNGFKAVGAAFKAIGIGIILALFAKLGEILSKNQKVVDFFSKTMTALEIVFNDLFSFVSDNFLPAFQRLKDFFANLTFEKVGNAIKANITERFNSLLDTLGFVGEAFTKLFEGDFSGALDSIKNAGKEMVDVMTGVPNTVDKVTETVVTAGKAIGEYTKGVVAQSEAIVENKNNAILAAAEQEKLAKQAEVDAERLRQIRDDEKKSFEERRKASEELVAVLDDQEKAMLAQAKAQTQAARDAIALNDNIENQAELTRALTNEIDVQATVAGFRSEQQAAALGLDKEELDLDQALLESKNNRSIEEKRFAAERIKDNELRIERLKEINEEERALEVERLNTIINSEFATVEAKRTAQDEIDQINQDAAQKEIELDEELTEKKKEEADARKKIRDLQVQNELALLDAVGQGLQQLSGIIGEETAAGKALAVAGALINTYAAIAGQLKAFSEVPIPGYAIAQAIVTGLAGFAAVKNILSVKVPGGGGGSAQGGSPSTAPTSRAPNFSAVGTSPATVASQAETTEAVSESNQQPIKAYVTSTEVTTQQALDRQILNSASISN